MKIQVTPVQRFRKEFYYPFCEKAHAFAAIAGKKTLPRKTVTGIRKLGFDVEILDTPPRVWEAL